MSRGPPEMKGSRIERIEVSAHTIPTDAPEADGRLSWDSTTIVIVRARAGGTRGIGDTYAHAAAATLVREKFAIIVEGMDAMAVPGLLNAGTCALNGRVIENSAATVKLTASSTACARRSGRPHDCPAHSCPDHGETARRNEPKKPSFREQLKRTPAARRRAGCPFTGTDRSLFGAVQ